MKVAVLGAGGIVGQWMILTRPENKNVEIEFIRRTPGCSFYTILDCSNSSLVTTYLDSYKPDVIINLAGQNNVDVVEHDPDVTWPINVGLPKLLSRWSDQNECFLIQISTQAVFSGNDPPYGPDSPCIPVNEYGRQKAAAEWEVQQGDCWTIVRLTFVLGVRPFPAIGRPNPLEGMFKEDGQFQTDDRHFSIVDARRAAQGLWDLLFSRPRNKEILHFGSTERWSRYKLVKHILDNPVTLVASDYFSESAPRPIDTTWEVSDGASLSAFQIMLDSLLDRGSIENMDHERRSSEISIFLGVPLQEARDRLSQGFHHNHALVAKDFNDAGTNANDEASLLEWYRTTDAYIWELSAYHLSPGFNYSGMCQGQVNHLTTREKPRVLCMGDGIGDLALACAKGGLDPVYHDLKNSRTADFAQTRFSINHPIEVHLTETFDPDFLTHEYDAVVALDFFEHLFNVEEWVQASFDMLRPDGLFIAQNAFGIGDAEHGNSIPMHLSKNNIWEKEWNNLLEKTGFERTGEGEWWRKP